MKMFKAFFRFLLLLIYLFFGEKVEKKSTFITSLPKIRTGEKLNFGIFQGLANSVKRHYSTKRPNINLDVFDFEGSGNLEKGKIYVLSSDKKVIYIFNSYEEACKELTPKK
jgi:hypothetical protein